MPQDTMTAFRGSEGGRGEREAGREGMLKIISTD